MLTNREVSKIRFKGDEYEVHTVQLTKKDIKNLKNGKALMFFNKGAGQVIALSMEDSND